MRPIVGIYAGLLLALVFWSPSAFAETKVVTSEGRYVMGDLDTKKDAKAIALMEAKRLALEKVGTYLEASSEVENYELTKDEIDSLTAGVISVEILDEKWELSGENMMVTIKIQATVDTADLEERISALKDNRESVEEYKDIQAQLAALQKELENLKAQQPGAGPGKEREPAKEEIKKKYGDIVDSMNALEHFKAGKAKLDSKQWRQAFAEFEKALSIDPQLAEAYTGQAVALMNMEKLSAALDNINKSLEIKPASARSHAVKARILYQLGSYGSALRSINEAIKIDPRNSRFYYGRGNIYLKIRQPLLAAKDFKHACEMGDMEACKSADELARRNKDENKDKEYRQPEKRTPQIVKPRIPRPRR